ncbi:hypothetical protein [Streptococcus pneumoniae]|uniref:hypothetical protein n=1 Tax=Streptococcus pneumoniae TaxID=1313 RepID=UPI0005E119F5|nr:hypothetical protein [Streptococcus pneumoniae]CJG12912.1 chlorohydrolase [Streptococcus pneumoniae]
MKLTKSAQNMVLRLQMRHGFEVVDETDEVSSKHGFEVADVLRLWIELTKSAQNTVLRL